MKISEFVVPLDKKRRESIIAKWTVGIQPSLFKKIQKLSKHEKKCLNESVRHFLDHIVSVYSKK